MLEAILVGISVITLTIVTFLIFTILKFIKRFDYALKVIQEEEINREVKVIHIDEEELSKILKPDSSIKH